MKPLSLNLTCAAVGALLGASIMALVRSPAPPQVAAAPATRPGKVSPAPVTAPVAAPKSTAQSGDAGSISDVRPELSPAPPAGVTPVAAPAAQDDSERRLASAKIKVEKLYGPFLKRLAETGGDAGKFRDKLVERQMITSDILAAGRAQGINMMDPTASKPLMDLMRRSVSEYSQQMRQEVGEPAYQAWATWERVKPDYNVGLELNRRLESTGDGLTSSQLDQFAATLNAYKDASGRKNASAVPDPDGAPIVIRMLQAGAIEQVRPLLSPQQFDKLMEFYQEQQRGAMNLQLSPTPRS